MGRMDHRCGTRHAVDARVVLYPRGLAGVAGRIREASISGMFVEAPPAVFADNNVIDVEVTLPGVAALRTYRWQAMVVRRTTTGLGLMFDQLRPPAISRLLTATDGALAPAAPPRAGERSGATPGKPAAAGTVYRHGGYNVTPLTRHHEPDR